MHIALYAPGLNPDAGGVWQYYQWVIRYLSDVNKYSLMTSSSALSGLEKIYSLPAGTGKISVEKLLEDFEGKLSYRLLDPNKQKRLLNWLPYSGTMTSKIRTWIYNEDDGDLLIYWLRNSMKKAGIDVVHVPIQEVLYPMSIIGRFPYVINPHDYQHEYFPEFFSPEQLAHRREVWYSDQRNASAIVVHSRQTYSDAIRYLGVSEDKVFYAPYGPIDTYAEPDKKMLSIVKSAYSLPDHYLLYPARAWPHKNHEILVKAAAELKKRGIFVQLVFTDGDTEYGKKVNELIQELGLAKQIRFIGRIDQDHMGAVYRLCRAIVVPSLFEQNSGPMLEGISMVKPVAVSNLTELVETIGPDGLVFNAHSRDETVEILEKLWVDDKVVEELTIVSASRKHELSWDQFIKTYQSAYEYAYSHG